MRSAWGEGEEGREGQKKKKFKKIKDMSCTSKLSKWFTLIDNALTLIDKNRSLLIDSLPIPIYRSLGKELPCRDESPARGLN